MIESYCFSAPFGYCTLYAQGEYICRLSFEKNENKQTSLIIKKAKDELEEYFSGSRRSFDIPLLFQKETSFQRQIRQALATIDYGETKSYKQLAQQINHLGAARAVGAACHRNPLPIFIPCHRVIGSNQKLIGYNGGLKIKNYLLELEQKCL